MNTLYQLIDRIFANSYCSFKEQYSLYCPACGMTRALKYALKFEFVNSIKSNPMILLIIMDMTIIGIIALIKKHYKFNVTKSILTMSILTLIIWVIFAIVRNWLLISYGIDFLGDLSPT